MSDLGRRELLLAGAASLVCGCVSGNTKLRGSGATLPAHQYAAWWAAYAIEVPQVEIAYLPIGSGGGIRQLAEGTVDFGATDVEIDEVERKLIGREVVSIPTAIIAVAVCYNLGGLQGLRLSRQLCAAIYLGEVKRWDDPADVQKALDDVGGAQNILITEYEADHSYEGNTLEEVAKSRGITPVALYIEMVKNGDAGIIGKTMPIAYDV